MWASLLRSRSVSSPVLARFKRTIVTVSPVPRDFGFTISSFSDALNRNGRTIRKAAALVIGDEILNGKTHDRNSHVFARFCFEHGVQLCKIEVIADDENEIVEASRRMTERYDFVVTSGGIGPTHDDITYSSLAKAFSQRLSHHTETQRRMDEMNKHRPWVASQDAHQKAAVQRMALFPENAEVLFVAKDMWVPVIRLEGKLCVLPGIPSLFEKMLNGLAKFLPLPPPSERPSRVQVFTKHPESMIAPYLTHLQTRLKPEDIQIGSYPVLGQGVFVSLIGRGLDDQKRLLRLAEEVALETEGELITPEQAERKREEAREKGLAGVVEAQLVGGAGASHFISNVGLERSQQD